MQVQVQVQVRPQGQSLDQPIHSNYNVCTLCIANLFNRKIPTRDGPESLKINSNELNTANPPPPPNKYILSCASEMGSPTNHPDSGQRQDTGSGILWSVHRWTIATYKKFKKKNGPYIRPVLLRQGEPGTSHYVFVCSM